MGTSMGEGKTIEKAIEDALNKLKVSQDEVDIEIVQEPSLGVLRWKSNPAIVRLTLKKKTKSPSQLGMISVVDGQLHYTEPPALGIPARLRFSAEFHVLYNNEVIEREVTLTKGLEPLKIILPEDKEPELHYEIRVNPEKTEAELFWKRIPGVLYCLADHAPSNQLNLSIKKTLVEASTLTLKDVQHMVTIEGLKYGLQLHKLTEEMLKAPHGLITIATSLPPKPAQEPSISYVFQKDAPSIDPDALRIDHYETHGIHGVKPGAILAIKDPGKPGTPGVDVYGNPIAIAPVKDIHIEIGDGVALSADGLQAIATIPGLPSLHSGVVKVTSVFELDGNADVSTGNITIDGTIIIKGNVLENVKVESISGDIVVNGLVSGALLRTNGSITILRNAVRSQLFAGGTTVTQIRLLSMINQIGSQLQNLIKAYEAIILQAEQIPFENLIKHLLELKFHQLPKEIKAFADYVQRISSQCTEELLTLQQDLTTYLVGAGPLQITDIEVLKELLANLRVQELRLEDETNTESNVTVWYLQNSQIDASGYVEVTGQGCFYSNILAGRGFKIPSGVVRGGEVAVNEGNIIAKELGGPTGIHTFIQIMKDGRINANHVQPNVEVAIREQRFTFNEAASQVKIFLQAGILTVYSGSNKIHG